MTDVYIYNKLAFSADIGRKPASPARGSRKRLHRLHAGSHTPARAGLVGDAYTPADGTKDRDLVSLNMAAPVRSVTEMRDNPKTINRSGVYIYNNGIK